MFELARQIHAAMAWISLHLATLFKERTDAPPCSFCFFSLCSYSLYPTCFILSCAFFSSLKKKKRNGFLRCAQDAIDSLPPFISLNFFFVSRLRLLTRCRQQWLQEGRSFVMMQHFFFSCLCRRAAYVPAQGAWGDEMPSPCCVEPVMCRICFC